jgi:hypothetical protein
MREAVPPAPNKPLWHGTGLSTGYDFMSWYFVQHRDNFTFCIKDYMCIQDSDHWWALVKTVMNLRIP